MTIFEELRLLLRIDSGSVPTDLEKFKKSVSEAAEHGHKSFLHVGSAGRSFHKVLEQLTEQSPLLGNALRLAINPIVGTMLAAAAAFRLANEKLKEWNAEMDKVGARNAKPLLSIEEARGVKAEQAKILDEYSKFINEKGDGAKQILDALDLEQQKIRDVMDLEKGRIELHRQLGSMIIQRSVDSGSISQSVGFDTMQRFQTAMAKRSRDNEMAALSDRLSGLQSARENLFYQGNEFGVDAETYAAKAARGAGAIATQKGVSDSYREMLNDAKEQLAKTEKEIQDIQERGGNLQFRPDLIQKQRNQLEFVDTYNNQLKDSEKRLTELQKAQDEVNDAFSSAKNNAKSYETALRDVEGQINKTRQEQSKLASTPTAPGVVPVSSPYTFSTGDLAQYNTRYGAIAREIIRRQQVAMYATAAGRPDIARSINNTIYGEDIPDQKLGLATFKGGHRNGLYDLLPPGLTDEQQQRQRIKADMDAVIQSLSQSGASVPVTIADIKGE